jgi:hypothetical protein
MFSNSFAGIAPSNVAMFLVMQLVGGVIGYALIRSLYPNAAVLAADVTTHRTDTLAPTPGSPSAREARP